MSAPTGWIRFIMLTWAALQLALPSVLTVMDANLSSAAVGVVGAHVESSSTPACHRVHGADCTFCQFLSNCLGTISRPHLARIVALADARPSATVPDQGIAAARRLPGSRAPPVG